MTYPVVIWSHGPNTITALREENGLVECEWSILGQLTTRYTIANKFSGQMAENFMIERCKALGIFPKDKEPEAIPEPAKAES